MFSRKKRKNKNIRVHKATLGQQPLYMLPTRQGLIFAGAMLAMLLMAVNYNNGMAYLFTFFLISIAVLSMLYTQRNLQGLELTLSPGSPVFAGQNSNFELCINNGNSRHRPAVWIHSDKHMSNVNIDGGQRLSQIVTAMTTHRGYVNAPVVSLSSAYPLGLLYSWCRPVLFRCQSLVYPAPIKIRPLVVTPRQHRHSLGSNLQQEGDDFSGLRDWHRGDSTKHVHWKSAARGHGLYTKEFAGEAADDVWLAWDTLQGMEHEQRIGQLCQWVLEAEERNLRYGLQLPGEDITVDSGPTHRHHCLKALALL